MWTVRAHKGRDLDPIPPRVEAGGRFGFSTDGIDAGVRPSTFRQLRDAVVDVLLHEIDGLGARLARKRETLGHRIDGQNPFGTE